MPADKMALHKLLEFMKLIGNLKHLKRTGWVKRNVQDPETVTGHMYRMAVISFLFDEDDSVDTNKLMRMCLVHDMAESIVGDITPHCGISDEDKHAREVAAMDHIKALVGEASGQKMLSLFLEYEEQKTSESHLVKDLDKFDMILQAFEYEEKEGTPGRLQEFFTSTEGVFKNPRVIEWVTALKDIRNSRLLQKES